MLIVHNENGSKTFSNAPFSYSKEESLRNEKKRAEMRANPYHLIECKAHKGKSEKME